MRIGIATDHGGFGLKEELLTRLRERLSVEQHAPAGV
jgi:ribose 5-phosphate isomerase RpiB